MADTKQLCDEMENSQYQLVQRRFSRRLSARVGSGLALPETTSCNSQQTIGPTAAPLKKRPKKVSPKEMIGNASEEITNGVECTGVDDNGGSTNPVNNKTKTPTKRAITPTKVHSTPAPRVTRSQSFPPTEKLNDVSTEKDNKKGRIGKKNDRKRARCEKEIGPATKDVFLTEKETEPVTEKATEPITEKLTEKVEKKKKKKERNKKKVAEGSAEEGVIPENLRGPVAEKEGDLGTEKEPMVEKRKNKKEMNKKKVAEGSAENEVIPENLGGPVAEKEGDMGTQKEAIPEKKKKKKERINKKIAEGTAEEMPIPEKESEPVAEQLKEPKKGKLGLDDEPKGPTPVQEKEVPPVNEAEFDVHDLPTDCDATDD